MIDSFIDMYTVVSADPFLRDTFLFLFLPLMVLMTCANIAEGRANREPDTFIKQDRP